jgi:hypothetical protein
MAVAIAVPLAEEHMAEAKKKTWAEYRKKAASA